MADNPLDMTTQSPVTIGGGYLEDTNWQDPARDAIDPANWQEAAQAGLAGWEDAARSAMGLGGNSYFTTQITPYYAGGGQYVGWNSAGSAALSSAGAPASTPGAQKSGGAGASGAGYSGGRTQVVPNGAGQQQSSANPLSSLLGGSGGLLANFGNYQQSPQDLQIPGINIPQQQQQTQTPQSSFGGLLQNTQQSQMQLPQMGQVGNASNPTAGASSSSQGPSNSLFGAPLEYQQGIMGGSTFGGSTGQFASPLPPQNAMQAQNIAPTAEMAQGGGIPGGQSVASQGASMSPQMASPAFAGSVPSAGMGVPSMGSPVAPSATNVAREAIGPQETPKPAPKQDLFADIKDSRNPGDLFVDIKDSKKSLWEKINAPITAPGIGSADTTQLKALGESAAAGLASAGRGLIQNVAQGTIPVPGGTLTSKIPLVQDILKQAPAQERFAESELQRKYAQFPGTTAAGKIIGGTLPFIAMPGGATKAGLGFGKSVLNSAFRGSLGGAVVGGSQYAETLMDKAKNILTGSVVGGLFGPAAIAVGKGIQAGAKVSGINALFRKISGKEQFSPTSAQIQRTGQLLQKGTLDETATQKVTEAAKAKNIPLTPGERTGNPVLLAKEGRMAMTQEGQLELARRNAAREVTAKKETEAVLQSMLPEKTTSTQAKTLAGKAYKELDQVTVNPEQTKPLTGNPVIQEQLRLLEKSKVWSGAQFSNVQLGKWRKLERFMKGQIDEIYQKGNRADDLIDAHKQVKAFLDKSDVNYTATNKLYQKAILYDKYKNQLMSYQSPTGDQLPGSSKIYRALFGSEQDRSKFLRDLKTAGGDMDSATKMMRILGSLDNSTIQRTLKKDPSMISNFMAESGPQAIASGLPKRVLVGHYNNQIMNLITNPKYQDRLTQIANMKPGASQTAAVLDLLSRATAVTATKPNADVPQETQQAIQDVVDSKRPADLPKDALSEIQSQAKDDKSKALIQQILTATPSEIKELTSTSKGRLKLISYLKAQGKAYEADQLERKFREMDGTEGMTASTPADALLSRVSKSVQPKPAKPEKTPIAERGLLPEMAPKRPQVLKKPQRRMIIRKNPQQRVQQNKVLLYFLGSMMGDSPLARLFLSMLK